jgi:anti-anti-sigma regulatory factor
MILQTLPAALAHWNLFKIEGQLDFASAPAVRTALAHAATMDDAHLLVDLEDLVCVDDVGIRTLVEATQALRARRPACRIAFVAPPGVAERLVAAGIAREAVYDSGQQALQALGAAQAAA